MELVYWVSEACRARHITTQQPPPLSAAPSSWAGSPFVTSSSFAFGVPGGGGVCAAGGGPCGKPSAPNPCAIRSDSSLLPTRLGRPAPLRAHARTQNGACIREGGAAGLSVCCKWRQMGAPVRGDCHRGDAVDEVAHRVLRYPDESLLLRLLRGPRGLHLVIVRCAV